MFIKPYEDQFVVLPDAPEEQVRGIYLPDGAKKDQTFGTVLAVGPGKRDYNGDRIPMDVKVGDKVAYAKYGGIEVKLGERDASGKDIVYNVLREIDILGTVCEGTWGDPT